jgi:hypothetical protein
MGLLHIALQEGFEDETVVIRAAGKEVFRKDNVRTKLQIGLADSFEVNVEESPVTIEIDLPAKNLTESIEVQAPNTVHLGLSLIEGQIRHRISSEPFGYV